MVGKGYRGVVLELDMVLSIGGEAAGRAAPAERSLHVNVGRAGERSLVGGRALVFEVDLVDNLRGDDLRVADLNRGFGIRGVVAGGGQGKVTNTLVLLAIMR